MSFYYTERFTLCPPGVANGADDLTLYSDYGCDDEAVGEWYDEEEEEEDRPDGSEIRHPLDYYFPRD